MNRKLQGAMFIIMALLFSAVYFFTQKQIDEHANRPLPEREVAVIRPDISVVRVTANAYQAQISAFGATQPRFTLNLTTQVAGQVNRLADRFDAGMTVEQGEILAWLEDSDYVAAVSEAEQQLAESQLLYQQEERQGMQAAAEWLASGIEGEPDTDLVLRKPQLASAAATLENAKAQLVSAQKALQFTHIEAPFDALIISRDIAPGSYAAVGSQIGTLYSTDRLEIRLSLSDREWQQLPELATLMAVDWPVQLHAVEGKGQWQGQVVRMEQHLDGTTRQRSLIIGVDNPLAQQPTLHPGTFVNVSLAGKSLNDLWRLPLTSLSQRGEVWYVDSDNTLAKFATSAVFTNAEALYIQPPTELANTSQSILIQPIDSYLEGMAITPIEVSTDD